MFSKRILDLPVDLFDNLSNSVKFEQVARGRLGANLVKPINKFIPIVRTTTNYTNPNQLFSPIHIDIVDKIKKVDPKLEFNNALIELYNNQYCTMGFHTDQTLDLKDNSTICLYTCYNNPDTKHRRKLVVKNKTTSEIFEVELDHNSIVCFTVDENRNHQHKIVLDNPNLLENELWLGITFRFSKTMIYYDNGVAFFDNYTALTLANDSQKKSFFRLKRIENKQIDFTNPTIDYTMSQGDLISI